MRRIRFILGIVLIAATASCIVRPGARDRSLSSSAQWTAVLPATTTGPHGGMTFVRLDPPGQTRVIIALAGGTPSAILPWHLHYGQCGDDGLIVGAPGNYSPLMLGPTGRLDAVAQIPIALSDNTRYFLHVHVSPADMKAVAGCAPLVRTAPATTIANVTR